MQKVLLAAALLLSACAPAYTGPNPAPNEVIVEAPSNVPTPVVKLSPEDTAGVRGLSVVTVLLVFQNFGTGLPAGYERFDFANGDKSMTQLSEKGKPLHTRVQWRSVNPGTKHTVDVQWETQPVGGKLLRVAVTATTTDASVNTQRIEDALLRAFVNSKDITLVAKGR